MKRYYVIGLLVLLMGSVILNTSPQSAETSPAISVFPNLDTQIIDFGSDNIYDGLNISVMYNVTTGVYLDLYLNIFQGTSNGSYIYSDSQYLYAFQQDFKIDYFVIPGWQIYQWNFTGDIFIQIGFGYFENNTNYYITQYVNQTYTINSNDFISSAYTVLSYSNTPVFLDRYANDGLYDTLQYWVNVNITMEGYFDVYEYLYYGGWYLQTNTNDLYQYYNKGVYNITRTVYLALDNNMNYTYNSLEIDIYTDYYTEKFGQTVYANSEFNYLTTNINQSSISPSFLTFDIDNISISQVDFDGNGKYNVLVLTIPVTVIKDGDLYVDISFTDSMYSSNINTNNNLYVYANQQYINLTIDSSDIVSSKINDYINLSFFVNFSFDNGSLYSNYDLNNFTYIDYSEYDELDIQFLSLNIYGEMGDYHPINTNNYIYDYLVIEINVNVSRANEYYFNLYITSNRTSGFNYTTSFYSDLYLDVGYQTIKFYIDGYIINQNTMLGDLYFDLYGYYYYDINGNYSKIVDFVKYYTNYYINYNDFNPNFGNPNMSTSDTYNDTNSDTYTDTNSDTYTDTNSDTNTDIKSNTNTDTLTDNSTSIGNDTETTSETPTLSFSLPAPGFVVVAMTLFMIPIIRKKYN